MKGDRVDDQSCSRRTEHHTVAALIAAITVAVGS